MTTGGLPALWFAHAGADARRPSWPAGRHRPLPPLPVVLVRRAREPDPHSWLDARALPHHRREHRATEDVSRRHGEVPALQRPTAADARHATRDEVRVPEVPERPRPPDDV